MVFPRYLLGRLLTNLQWRSAKLHKIFAQCCDLFFLKHVMSSGSTPGDELVQYGPWHQADATTTSCDASIVEKSTGKVCTTCMTNSWRLHMSCDRLALPVSTSAKFSTPLAPWGQSLANHIDT